MKKLLTFLAVTIAFTINAQVQHSNTTIVIGSTTAVSICNLGKDNSKILFILTKNCQ